MTELVRVFRTRQLAVATRIARIARTDALIDQIAYALYNLSADEIALVKDPEAR